jgi:hypothetical protein
MEKVLEMPKDHVHYLPVISSGKIESSTSRSSIWSSRPMAADPPADWRGNDVSTWRADALGTTAQVEDGRLSAADQMTVRIMVSGIAINIMLIQKDRSANRAWCQYCGPTCKPVKQPLRNLGGASPFFYFSQIPCGLQSANRSIRRSYPTRYFYQHHTPRFLQDFLHPAMGKPRPQKKKSSKPREKSVLGPGGSISTGKMAQDPSTLLDQATILLQTGRADEALVIAQQALELTAENTTAQLPAINLLGEINVELGDIDTARNCFLQAVQLDQDGSIPESQGGGAEKFLWLAQLSEQGGKDSVLWFEMGVTSLRQSIAALESKASPSPEEIADIAQKKTKMSNALCAVAETYMTDLS